MKRSLISKAIWLLSATALILIGLWHLNLTIYHVWAADQFLSGSQEVSDWHQKCALIFLGVSLALFIGAGMIIWQILLRKRPAESVD